MSAHTDQKAISAGPDEEGNWAMLTQETQEMMMVPPFSQWTHDTPILVQALAAHGGVPEQEVVDHLKELFKESSNNPDVGPLDEQADTVRRYLDAYVA